MTLKALVRDAVDGGTSSRLAEAFDVAPAQADAVLAHVLPELAWGLERNTLSRGGLADLLSALSTGGHEDYLNATDVFTDVAVRDDGNAILGHILGSRGASRRVAGEAARMAGLSGDVVKRMLPYLASILMGSIAKGGRGALGEVLSRLPAGQRAQIADAGAAAGSAGDSYSGDGPLPGPGANYRLPGDAGSSQGGGSAGPYGDLSDILRKTGPNFGTGSLGKIVRDVLGGLLGFQSGGILSWLIKLIVVRFGWRIVRFIFGRLFLGR